MLSTDIVVDPASGEHLPHLDFILKLVSESPFLKTYNIDPHSFDECSVQCAEYTKQTVGFHIGELERLPSVDQPHMRTFFPMESLQGAVQNQPTHSLDKSVILAHYFSPHDTKILLTKKGNARKDQFELVLETNGCQGGHVKLCPVKSNAWGSNLVSDETGQLYLKHIHVNTKWNTTGSETTIIPNFISFICPWPSQAKKWFTREKPSKWICTCATKHLKDSCHVIPVSHNKSSNSEIEWKLSFMVAEDWVINHCLKQFRVKVFHVLKFLVSTLVKEEIEGLRDVIRHTFFHACDMLNENHFDERPARCILYIITDLLHKLLSGFVPHYFMTTINLIDHLPEDAKTSLVKKLKLLRYNPTMCIYFFLDSYRLTYTELSNEFNSMIDDSQRLFLHGDIQQSKRQFFIPKYIRRICDLIAWQMYAKAEKECISAFEEMTSVEAVISFTDWVDQVLIKLPITDRWCFAFYLDHLHQSCLLKHVCERLPTEPFVNLFGPDIVCNMKELNVPSQSVCQQYVIDFVEKFTNSLCSLGLHYEVIVALKFFLTLIYDETTGVYMYRNMSLETVHHSECVSHSCATCSCHKVPQQHANLTRIAVLYQRFYSSCCHVKKMDVFKPFQQRFGLICETLASQHFYNILSEMHERYARLDNEEGRQQMPVKETMI
ncbi:hypothetical protein ACJMK2_024793 [Sinanodonta woodiana]|uniref:Mab-21-like HhH/H2TH-like domain-containing protein n=1 Tax=Sinanodonta woodiana TaxID=1069815 RepID=A0ABD3XEG8_SINWO